MGADTATSAGINVDYSGFTAYNGSLDTQVSAVGGQVAFGTAEAAALSVGTGFEGATTLVTAHSAVLKQMQDLLGQIHAGITTVQANGITIQKQYQKTDGTLAADMQPVVQALTT
jgi:hypothetical protein